MSRILIGPSTFATVDAAPLDRLRDAGFDIVLNPFSRKLSEQELLELLPGATGIIAGLEPLGRAVLERSSLRAISRCGAGLSNVDVVAAQRLGIVVRSTPDAPTAAVAELTIGALLVLLRHVVWVNAELHERRWNRRVGGQIEGKTVAVVGFGRIGRRVAALLTAFGAHVLAVDPSAAALEAFVRLMPLPEALRQADIVTLHASGEEPILSREQLAHLKRGAFVLNCGRGELIDEDALCDALDSGGVAGAWLDVFRDEPYHGPLTGYPQVLLTPHVGSLTTECRRRMEIEAVDNLLDALKSGR
jgi:D-3-phosphoglycerate dehydrogenase